MFFGETVPRDRVERCFELVERREGAARARLVVDGHERLPVRRCARQARIPVAIVNQGSTRADGCASIRVDSPLGAVLPALAADYLRRRLGP